MAFSSKELSMLDAFFQRVTLQAPEIETYVMLRSRLRQEYDAAKALEEQKPDAAPPQ